jgi:hypothetical protein
LLFADAPCRIAYPFLDHKGVFMISAPTIPGRSITTLATREVYRNHWMRVREDEILRSNGARGLYGVVEKHDAAIILPTWETCGSPTDSRARNSTSIWPPG